jgi:hypothetical protein
MKIIEKLLLVSLILSLSINGYIGVAKAKIAPDIPPPLDVIDIKYEGEFKIGSIVKFIGIVRIFNEEEMEKGPFSDEYISLIRNGEFYGDFWIDFCYAAQDRRCPYLEYEKPPTGLKFLKEHTWRIEKLKIGEVHKFETSVLIEKEGEYSFGIGVHPWAKSTSKRPFFGMKSKSIYFGVFKDGYSFVAENEGEWRKRSRYPDVRSIGWGLRDSGHHGI